MAKSTQKKEIIDLPAMKIQNLEVTLIGDSPLITHKWSEKAKKAMRDKQGGKATQKKDPKDPEQDYQDAIHRDEDGDYAFPSIGFKAAAVTACTSLDMTKVAARQTFHVDEEYVKIKGDDPVMREDMVRIGQGTADLRYRPEYKNWYTILRVTYNASVMTAEQVINIFNVAGFGVGVGEWRPEKNGANGRFHVANSLEVQELGLAT